MEPVEISNNEIEANVTDAQIVINGEANFKVGLVVREAIILTKFWRQTKEIQETKLVELCDMFNEIFGIEVPLVFENDELAYLMTGGGTLNNEAIRMYKTSLMTFLHMYAYKLLQNNFVLMAGQEDIFPGEVAANWSHTIFCLASRQTYFSSRDRGLFFLSNIKMLAPLGDDAGSQPIDAEINERYDLALATLVNEQHLLQIAANTED